MGHLLVEVSMDESVTRAVERDYKSARVAIYSEVEPESLDYFRVGIEKGFKKAYPDISIEYGGYMIPDGIMKNVPFWFISVDDIKPMAEALKTFLELNPYCHASIYTKYTLASHDHLGRKSEEVGYNSVYQR